MGVLTGTPPPPKVQSFTVRYEMPTYQSKEHGLDMDVLLKNNLNMIPGASVVMFLYRLQ
jgi:hypothetical protein